MPRCDARVAKQFDGYYTLQFMTAGAIELSYGQTLERLTGPWFWTAFPGPHIRFHPAPEVGWWEHRYVAFQGPLVGRWISEGLFFKSAQPAPRRGDLVSRFDELLTLALRQDHWANRRAINLLEGLLLELAAARAQPTHAPTWLDQFLEMLAQSRGRHLDYDAQARQLGMSLSTLRRRFERATGTPLHAHVLQLRVAEARRLMGESDLPIKAIADELGYRDVYFFSRQFKQHVGVSPAIYRRSRQT